MTPTAPLHSAQARLAVTPCHCTPDEFVPLLECSYGAYISAANPTGVGMPLSHPVCHNPVERPQDRHHCAVCGGDYCSVHAAPTAHDCARMRE